MSFLVPSCHASLPSRFPWDTSCEVVSGESLISLYNKDAYPDDLLLRKTCHEELNSPISSRFCTYECKDFSQTFMARLERVVVGADDGDILDVPLADAQSAVNLLQNVSSSPFLMYRSQCLSIQAMQATRFKAHRRRIHRLLVKLSQRYTLLPASLFIQGVKFRGGECHSSGSFADIYLAELNEWTVALKRLRMFQMIDESKRSKLQRVSGEVRLLSGTFLILHVRSGIPARIFDLARSRPSACTRILGCR